VMPHTPGPWLFQGDHVDDSKGLPLCRTARNWASFNPEDLRLIAQAPTMYELLKELEHSQDGVFCAWCEMAPVHHHPDCRLSTVLKAVEGECPPPSTTD